MSHLLKHFRGKVNLAYIDPPFDSKADYKKLISIKGKHASSDLSAFEETQYADMWAEDNYLQFMHDRLILIRELLSDSGCIFLHCDYHQSHYLRMLMDEIFGPSTFINEIIWQKCNTKNFTSKSLSNIHDTIFMYTKTKDYYFQELFDDLSQDYIDSNYRHYDENGERYRLLPLHAPGIRNGATGKPWKGIPPLAGSHWRFGPETLDDMDAKGLIQISEGGVPEYRKYLKDSEGVRIGTIWLDAKQLPRKEKNGYPTQKPESILEKVIRIGSRPGDIVFDCFMGSGTTQAVAMKLGRRFIGADINLGAVETTISRLNGIRQALTAGQLPVSQHPLYTGVDVFNVNNYDIFRNPAEAKEILKEALEIQPLSSSSVFDGVKDGFSVKIMPVNRIATRADLNDIIAGMDFKQYEKRRDESPGRAVEKFLLVCMGHEPNLAAALIQEAKPFLIEVKVVDILRDRDDILFKRSAEAKVVIRDGKLVIEKFYPLNLMQKLSYQEDNVEDWRQLVDSIKIDWNYDGAVLEPALIDMPEGESLVSGAYDVPMDAGTVRVKITDLLSESLELTVSAEE